MATRKDLAEEDLAIQHTLTMSAEERLELLASLIVEKITEDMAHGAQLYNEILGLQHA